MVRGAERGGRSFGAVSTGSQCCAEDSSKPARCCPVRKRPHVAPRKADPSAALDTFSCCWLCPSSSGREIKFSDSLSPAVQEVSTVPSGGHCRHGECFLSESGSLPLPTPHPGLPDPPFSRTVGLGETPYPSRAGRAHFCATVTASGQVGPVRAIQPPEGGPQGLVAVLPKEGPR